MSQFIVLFWLVVELLTMASAQRDIVRYTGYSTVACTGTPVSTIEDDIGVCFELSEGGASAKFSSCQTMLVYDIAHCQGTPSETTGFASSCVNGEKVQCIDGNWYKLVLTDLETCPAGALPETYVTVINGFGQCTNLFGDSSAKLTSATSMQFFPDSPTCGSTANTINFNVGSCFIDPIYGTAATVKLAGKARTSVPSKSPTTSAPSKAPTVSGPTQSPSTSKPSAGPTSLPSASPVVTPSPTSLPSASPVVTSSPTSLPSASPVVTSSPSTLLRSSGTTTSATIAVAVAFSFVVMDLLT